MKQWTASAGPAWRDPGRVSLGARNVALLALLTVAALPFVLLAAAVVVLAIVVIAARALGVAALVRLRRLFSRGDGRENVRVIRRDP